MEQVKKRGGSRQNAGRKPSTNKKKPLTYYVDENTINKIGKEKIKQYFLNLIQNMDYESKN